MAPPIVEPNEIQSATSGVDWITLTAPPPLDRDPLLALGSELVSSEAEKGARVREFRWKSYRGKATEHVAYGMRPDSAYLRVSSCLAHERLTRLLSVPGHPTRLDHQITIQLKTPLPSFGLRTLRSTRKRQNRCGAPVERSLHISTSGLWIGQVGNRSSRLFLRLYDKGIESGTAPLGTLWRMEGELKREAAEWSWDELKRTKVPNVYSASICRWLLERSGSPWRLPISTESISAPVMSQKRHPEVERTLQWLRTQCRSAVLRLWDAGYQAEVIEALGLFGLVRRSDPRGDRQSDD